MGKSYGKDVITQAIARVLGGMLSFVAVIVLTYCFDEAEIGKYNLVLSTLNVTTSLATLWLSQSILRFYDDNENKTFIAFSTFASLAVSVAVVAVCSIFQEMTPWAYVYCLTLVAYNIFDAIFRKTRRLLKYVLLELMFSAGRLFPMVLIARYTGRYDSVFISQSILLMAYMAVLLIKNCRHKIKLQKIDCSLFKKYMHYGLPLMGLSVSSWLLSSSARYIIAFYENNASVGIYSTVQSLSHSIYSMFTLIIVSAFHPIIVNQWNESKEKTLELVSKVIDYNIMFITPLVFYGCLKAPVLLGIFEGDSYSTYYSIFIWTAIGNAISGLSMLYHKYYELTQNTKWILIFNLISASVNIVLNIILVPIYGFAIAAFVSFISNSVYLVLVRLTTKKVFPVKLSFKVVSVAAISSAVFYVLDKLIVRSNNFITFIIEGAIYVIYIVAIYTLTKVFDIRPIIKSKLKKQKTDIQ